MSEFISFPWFKRQCHFYNVKAETFHLSFSALCQGKLANGHMWKRGHYRISNIYIMPYTVNVSWVLFSNELIKIDLINNVKLCTLTV